MVDEVFPRVLYLSARHVARKRNNAGTQHLGRASAVTSRLAFSRTVLPLPRGNGNSCRIGWYTCTRVLVQIQTAFNSTL
jgi:hypothetical protein